MRITITIGVSVLFNEPKLLKSGAGRTGSNRRRGFSALQRAEIAEITRLCRVLFVCIEVSVLFNEPKLLKFGHILPVRAIDRRFSALQRAEIAEIV